MTKVGWGEGSGLIKLGMSGGTSSGQSPAMPTAPPYSKGGVIPLSQFGGPERYSVLPRATQQGEACPRPTTPTAPIPSLPHPQALVFCLLK